MDDNPDPKTGVVNVFTPEFAACPQPVYRKMQEQCPVAHSALNHSPIIGNHKDVVWALRHPEIFSSEMGFEMALGTERPMIPQQIDPPSQTRYRRILDPLFSRKKMLEIESNVRTSANALIDQFVDAGECDLGDAFAIPLPCNAFLSLMGLPKEDLGTFLDLKDAIIRPQEKVAPEDAQAHRVASGKRIYAYFEKVIDDRRAHGSNDLMGALVSAEIDGQKLTRNEILDICFLLLLAGLDTVTATIGCNIAYLAQQPEQRRRIVEDPSKIPAAVEELLRWESPVVGVPRLVKEDVTLSGVNIKKGELALLLVGAANTDESAFENSDTVDFDRERNIHVAFGAGPHRCLGSHLARMELRVAMEEWHRRIPDYEIKPGESPRYSPGIREVRYLPLVWKTS